jgi:Ni/Co efflux regulator RcnB
MKHFVILSLLATALVPAAAQAHSSRDEFYRDRQDSRDERGDYRDAQRYGYGRNGRDERGDYRDARREYREDFRDRRGDYGHNGWRSYGYHGGYDGLPRAGYGTRWVRHHGDALLIDIRTGYVRNLIRGYYR